MSRLHLPWKAPLFGAVLVALVCSIGLWWRLGYLGLIDPDEPFYAESAHEMLAARDWTVPRIFGQPQFEKPPVVYWLTMASMKAFGETEFAARAPAALFASLLALLTLAFGRRAFGARAGLLGALVLSTSLEFLITGRMLLTDMILAAFVCASVFSLWQAAQAGARRERWFLAACLFGGLGVLTKGPLGLLIPALGAGALVAAGFRPFPRRVPPCLLGAALFAAVVVPWYATMIHRFGGVYIRSFFVHENVERFFHAEHRSNDRPYYYLAVLALGFLPWLSAVPIVVRRTWAGVKRERTTRALALWSLLCLVFFTLAASKLPTYILFVFVPLALVTGRALDAVLESGGAGRWEIRTATGLGLFQVAALAALPGFGIDRAFALPLGLAAAAVAGALVLLVVRRWTGWIAASALAGLAVPLLCLGLAGPSIDGTVSMRGLSRAVDRSAEPSEPLLASPILVRGVVYYTHRPVMVLSGDPSPFYTPHPLAVIGGRELPGLVAKKGAALCVATPRVWKRFAQKLSSGEKATTESIGDKVLVRVTATGSKGRSPAG